MQIPDFRLAYRALEEGLIDRADVVRLITVLENWHRGDLRVSCAELLSREFRLDANQVRRWESELAGQPSNRIGPYLLQRRVGQGGMGVVFEAEHPNLERHVALKILTPGRKEPAAIQRFLREVKSAGQFNHPNIVHSYDAGIDGDIPYLAMEFVEGENLFQFLLRQGPLSVERAVDWLTQAASALWFLESLGWTHGDGKPSNWIVTPRGTLKLVDLGLCRPPGRLRDPEMIHGSPPYIPPEQLGTGERIDIRSDLFALGATFYHLLTGRPPYEARTVADLVVAQKTTAIAPVSRARPDLPPALAAVIDRLLQKKAAHRYSGCAELATALESLPGAPRVLPPSIHQPSEEETARPARPAWLIAASVGAAACILVGAYFARMWWSPPSRVVDPSNGVSQTRPTGSGTAPNPSEPSREWSALWFQDERPWSEIFSWLDSQDDSAEVLGWKVEAENAFEAEASTAWRAVEADVASLLSQPDHAAALTRLDEFPARLRLGQYSLGHQGRVVEVGARRADRATGYVAALKSALARQDHVAARALIRRVGDEAALDRAYYRAMLEEACGKETWRHDALAMIRASRLDLDAQRSTLWDLIRDGESAPSDWSMVGNDPAVQWTRSFVEAHPALLDSSHGNTLLERLLNTGLLATADLQAIVMLSDVLDQPVVHVTTEMQAAKALAAAELGCRNWQLSETLRHWETLEQEQFARTAAVARYRIGQPADRIALRRGAFLRSAHFNATVTGRWRQTPTLSYSFAGDGVSEWRSSPGTWRTAPEGLAHRDDDRQLVETWVPFEGAATVTLGLVPRSESWDTIVAYGGSAVGLQYLPVGELRVVTGTRLRVASELERVTGHLLVDTLIASRPSTVTIQFDRETVAVTWGRQRVELPVRTVSTPGSERLGGFVSWYVPKGMIIERADICAEPAPVWIDARAEVVGFP